MIVLVLKVLVPLLSIIPIVRSEWSKQADMGVWELARRTAVSTAVAALVAIGLVADHMNQSGALAAAQDDAAEAREARRRIEELTSEQAAALTAAQDDAAEAGRALQRIENATAEVVALMRERDPGLTEPEALDRVADELRELEDQLTGLRMYGDVSELDVLGAPFIAGEGISVTSPLMQALEGTWDISDSRISPHCDQTALAKFSAVTENHPSFPFAHYALSDCAFGAGDNTWREHADRALEILRHTTEIAGHHSHHTAVYRYLRSRLEQPEPGR